MRAERIRSVARRKLGPDGTRWERQIEDAWLRSIRLSLTMTLHPTAREIARDQGFGFCDALIVAAALEARCDMLLSEDLQHGRAFGALRIVNPFRVVRPQAEWG